MGRVPLIAGNWKMHQAPEAAARLARDVAGAIGDPGRAEVAVCPPFVSIPAVRDALAGTPVQVGAQNGYPLPHGAFTGEVSMAMLAGLARFVIIGHSERREFFHESDEFVARKLSAAWDAGLTPILCVGERLADRERGDPQRLIAAQVWNAVVGQDSVDGLVVAYEPVWAIGTGRVAQPDDAVTAARTIRGTLAELFGEEAAAATRVLYGGSVKPDNVAGFLAQPEIDGALVGGASLDAAQFAAIVRAAV